MLTRRIDDRLGDGPEVGRCPAAVLAQALTLIVRLRQRAPEVDQREAVARAAAVQAPVVDLDLAVDGHVGRRGAQAGDLGVVADLDLQRLRGGAVGAGLEQQRVPVVPISLSTCRA